MNANQDTNSAPCATAAPTVPRRRGPGRTSAALACLVFLATLGGCGRSTAPSEGKGPETKAPGGGPLSQVLQTWQSGDSAAAVKAFLAADFSRRPLFAAGSPLNLKEAELADLPAAARDRAMKETTARLQELKQLARAVADRGKEALARGEKDQARKIYGQLGKCGAALDDAESLMIVRLVGQAVRKLAAEGTNLSQ